MLRHFLAAFRSRTRPEEQLVHAVRLLILPILEQGFAQGQAIVEADTLQTMVSDMFDPPDELASAPPHTPPSPCPLTKCELAEDLAAGPPMLPSGHDQHLPSNS